MKLKDGLDSLRKRAKSKRFGGNEQYSALLATLKELTVGVERPIIIFQTDGDELGSLRNAAASPPGAEIRATPGDPFKEYSLVDIYTAAEKTVPTYRASVGRVNGCDPEGTKATSHFISRARWYLSNLSPGNHRNHRVASPPHHSEIEWREKHGRKPCAASPGMP